MPVTANFFCTLRHLLLASGWALLLASTAARGDTPKYTTDLSPWGPHAKTSLKQSLSEPRWMKLQSAEREKVGGCFGAQMAAVNTMFNIGVIVFGYIKHDMKSIEGKLPSQPPDCSGSAEDCAVHVFRHMVKSELGTGLPIEPYGRRIAKLYGIHFGFQYWEEFFQLVMEDPLNKQGRDIEFYRRVEADFWPQCLEKIPTACFEPDEELDPKRCQSKLIHPTQFPYFDETADIYRKRGLKHGGW